MTHVTSCICFGTPFFGAEFAELYLTWNTVHMLEHDGMDFTRLLGLLKPNNRQLVELTIGFTTIVERMDPQTAVFCFWEKQEMNWAEHIKDMRERQNEQVKLDTTGAVPVPDWAMDKVKAFQKQVG